MRITWILILVVLAVACDQNKDFVTEGGTKVTVFEKGEGALQTDSVLLLYLKLQTKEGEVLMESSASEPLPVKYSDTIEAGHLQDVLNRLEVGDSVYFETTVQNLFEKTYRSPVPQGLNASDTVQVNMRLAEQMSEEAFRAFSQSKQEEMRAKELAMLEEKAMADADTIDAYLEKKGIEEYTTTDSGLRYVVTKEGSGPKPDAGDRVRVHYTGTLLNGEKFDSSVDRGDPLEFVLGQGRVIPGWDEALGYIKEGGKATLYIPSPLAYGSRSPSPKIPAYSILVFDVELVEVIEQNEQQQN